MLLVPVKRKSSLRNVTNLRHFMSYNEQKDHNMLSLQAKLIIFLFTARFVMHVLACCSAAGSIININNIYLI